MICDPSVSKEEIFFTSKDFGFSILKHSLYGISVSINRVDKPLIEDTVYLVGSVQSRVQWCAEILSKEESGR